ncbi:MAG: hypothetical protein K9J47_03835 [Sulfuritalea sp.]|nr:hypothetical protein [Polynucleobacter sp.]MCF8187886.1 hypothetical protein [Sulfuritalea sp.]
MNTEQSDSFIIDDSDDEFESHIDQGRKSDTSDESEKTQHELDKEKLLSLQEQRKSTNDKNEKEAFKLQKEINATRKNLGLPNENIKGIKPNKLPTQTIDGSDENLQTSTQSNLPSPVERIIFFNIADRNELRKISQGVLKCQEISESYQIRIDAIDKILDDSDGIVGEDEFQRDLSSLIKLQWQEHKKISVLHAQQNNIESRVISKAASLKEINDECQLLLESCKSEKTYSLEEKYDALVSELKQEHANSPYTPAKIAVAGASAFSVSFLIADTLSRTVSMSAYIPAFITGTLHVIAAGPVAKSIMPNMWSSPVLAELNNNFKLRGASWGEQWQGQASEKKYLSKYPEHPGKISIEQRLEEEQSLNNLLAARYKDEEASYFFFTMNYLLKAMGAAMVSKAFSTGTQTYKLIEATLHGVCGNLSGASYLFSQQAARSERNQSTNILTPTRKIFSSKAEELQSLLDDIENNLKKSESNPRHDTRDLTHHLLIKAQQQVQNELKIATLQASWLGLLRHELSINFALGSRLDTIAEIVGRSISLLPLSIINEVTSNWRNSSDPWLVFIGHALPAAILTMPPGLTARPLYSGAIRSALQMMCTIYENYSVPMGNHGSTPDDSDYFNTNWRGNPVKKDEETLL